MPRLYTNSIPDSQCIGDSLDTINNNSLNLDTAVQDLSSQTISITDTSTIDLTYNAGSRNLTASVKPASITPAFLSPTFTLSASQIGGKPEDFKKFRENLGDHCHSTNYRSCMYLSRDNTLYACGYGGGAHMRFGLGPNHVSYLYDGWNPLPIPLGVGEYVEKFYNTGYSNPSLYVLTNLGNIYCTGYNGYGQLGVGDTTTRHNWVRINLSNIVYFETATNADDANHCFAINSAGELYAWGYNGYGNLGNGNTTQQNSPIRINTGAIAGKVIKKAFAINDYNFSFVIDSNDLVYSAGYNGNGQLGQNNTTNSNTFQNIFNQATIKADYIVGNGGGGQGLGATGCAFLVRNNEVWSCGYNGYGQLGLGDTTNRSVFTKINNVSVDQITVFSNGYTCVIVKQLDGTLRVWGYNWYDALGVPTLRSISTPRAPSNNPSNVVKVLGHGWNYIFSAYLDSNGDIYTTGYNGYGNLGLGDSTDRTTYQKVIKNANVKFIDFDLGGSNSGNILLAVDENRNLWACGHNGNYNLPYPGIGNNYEETLRKTAHFTY